MQLREILTQSGFEAYVDKGDGNYHKLPSLFPSFNAAKFQASQSGIGRKYKIVDLATGEEHQFDPTFYESLLALVC